MIKQETTKNIWDEVRQSVLKFENVDVPKLAKLCKEHGVPDDLRGNLWQIFLHAKRDEIKFEKISELKSEEQTKNDKLPKNLEQLVNDCKELRNEIQALKLDSQINSNVLDSVDEIIAQYCRGIKVPYKDEMRKLIAPYLLIDPKLTKSEIYNCLSAQIEQFVPFLFRGGNELVLVLQYHDPILSLHFDANRIDPEVYVLPWITTLMANQIALHKIYKLWDLFFVRGDPLMPVFFAISLLMKRREMILNLKHDLISEALASLKIDDLEEIPQLFNKAVELDKETPLATRNQMLALFYPSKDSNTSALHDLFKRSVVLPVPTSELIEAFKKKKPSPRSIRYITIDCRSLKSFRFARLPTAVHIGATIGYDPKKLENIVKQFESAKGSHFTLFGTGRRLPDEENLLKVIAMRFLTRGFPHISIAPGGFKDCIKYISSDQIEYVRDEDVEEQKTDWSLEELKKLANQVDTSVITSKVKTFGMELFNWGKKVAEPILSRVDKTRQPQQSATTSQPKQPEIKEPPKSAFSLTEDDDEEDHGESSVKTTLYTEPKEEQKIVKIDDLKKLGDSNGTVHIFPCKLKIGKQVEHRYIAVGDNFILCMKAHPTMLGTGILIWKRTLKQLLRITYHKQNNTIITFVLAGRANTLSADAEATGTFQETFIMENSLECTKVIKENMLKLKKQAQQNAQKDKSKESSQDTSQKQENDSKLKKDDEKEDKKKDAENEEKKEEPVEKPVEKEDDNKTESVKKEEKKEVSSGSLVLEH